MGMTLSSPFSNGYLRMIYPWCTDELYCFKTFVVFYENGHVIFLLLRTA